MKANLNFNSGVKKIICRLKLLMEKTFFKLVVNSTE